MLDDVESRPSGPRLHACPTTCSTRDVTRRPRRARQVRARVRLHAARRAAADLPARARLRHCTWSCSARRRSAPSASSTSPTGSSSTGRCCSARRCRLRVSVQRAAPAPARARVRLRLRGARGRRARVGGLLDEPQARRRRRVASATPREFEDPPVTAQWRLPGRPRPPLRRASPATTTRSTCTAGRPRPSASRARSPTGCGRRRAASPRCGCRTRSTADVRFKKPILLPSKVTFGEAEDRFAVHGHLEGTLSA